MATDSSLYPYALADEYPRPADTFGVATDGVPDITSDGGSVLSLTSFPTSFPT
jgi:hypothetical protein